MGAIAVIELREAMAKDEAEDRRLLIAEEVRGGQDTDQTAGPSMQLATQATYTPKASTFQGAIPKYSDRVWVARKDERERFRSACGYRGASSSRAKPHSKHGRSRGGSRGGSSHHHPSAGLRDVNGDRVLHPRQDRGHRAGAGQPARQAGRRSATDSHGRRFGEESTDWSEWEEEEGGQQE